MTVALTTPATSATTPTDFTVRKVTGRIGAEISGLDIARPLAAETVAALRAARRTCSLWTARREWRTTGTRM